MNREKSIKRTWKTYRLPGEGGDGVDVQRSVESQMLQTLIKTAPSDQTRRVRRLKGDPTGRAFELDLMTSRLFGQHMRMLYTLRPSILLNTDDQSRQRWAHDQTGKRSYVDVIFDRLDHCARSVNQPDLGLFLERHRQELSRYLDPKKKHLSIALVREGRREKKRTSETGRSTLSK